MRHTTQKDIQVICFQIPFFHVCLCATRRTFYLFYAMRRYGMHIFFRIFFLLFTVTATKCIGVQSSETRDKKYKTNVCCRKKIKRKKKPSKQIYRSRPSIFNEVLDWLRLIRKCKTNGQFMAFFSHFK